MFQANAAMTAQRTVGIVTTLVSTSPLPIVEATAPPRSAPVRLKNAAMAIALRGVRKAVAVFKNDRRNDDGKEGQHSRSRLRVFQRDLKNDVSCVAAAVDHLLQ